MGESVAKFDELLQRSDSDSSTWTDGGDAWEAEGMLATLTQEEWLHVKDLCSNRDARWRACLASILRPQQGELAKRLMLDLAWDQDPEVAFLAVSGIAFYCGVNDSAKGAFFDSKIRNASFTSLAKTTDGLKDQIDAVSAYCHPQIQQRFELLAKLLSER